MAAADGDASDHTLLNPASAIQKPPAPAAAPAVSPAAPAPAHAPARQTVALQPGGTVPPGSGHVNLPGVSGVPGVRPQQDPAAPPKLSLAAPASEGPGNTTIDTASRGPGHNFEYPANLTRKGLPDVESEVDAARFTSEPPVHEAGRARFIFDSAVQMLGQQFNMHTRQPIQFGMVQSADYSELSNSGEQGVTTMTPGCWEVFILEEIDGDDFWAASTHEFAHTWFFENTGLKNPSKEIVEGFPTWIEYKFQLCLSG